MTADESQPETGLSSKIDKNTPKGHSSPKWPNYNIIRPIHIVTANLSEDESPPPIKVDFKK